MRNLTPLRRGGLSVVVAVVILISGCNVSSDASAGRDLAATVKIQGYRKVSERSRAETTELYFAGPPGVDLRDAVSAQGWSPEPPPSDLPDAGAYKWVVGGPVTTGTHHCYIVVSTLRPGFESVAVDLSDQERRDLAAARLVYVQVTSNCVAN